LGRTKCIAKGTERCKRGESSDGLSLMTIVAQTSNGKTSKKKGGSKGGSEGRRKEPRWTSKAQRSSEENRSGLVTRVQGKKMSRTTGTFQESICGGGELPNVRLAGKRKKAVKSGSKRAGTTVEVSL